MEPKKLNIALKSIGYIQNKERIWDMIELKFHEIEYFCCGFGLILLLGSYILDCFCYFIYLFITKIQNNLDFQFIKHFNTII